MWVVKLGGSLHAAPELNAWLEGLATAEGPARVVVPGGGPFADQVRAAQRRHGFDDRTAHRMAILAMQQFALLLAALEPRLALAETMDELRTARATLWLPWRLVGRDDTIEASWRVTSDSLALILAQRLAADRLVLVKRGRADAPDLLDDAFPRLAAGFAGAVTVLPADQPAALAAELVGASGAKGPGGQLAPFVRP
jgi:aspartokinase-like uncharacterized kinase